MKNPSVSIIIPIYNVEQYLDKCVTSILNQSFKNIELILIDDGSTDKSSTICETFSKQDKRVKYISQKNSGAPTALNKGIQIALGEYLWFVDSDDYIEENAVEILYNYAKKYEADMVIFGANAINDNQTQIASHQKEYWGLSSVEKQFSQKISSYRDILPWLINLPTVPWNKFHRREFIKENTLFFDPELLAPYDAFFNICCYLKNPKIIFCPDRLYNYRISDGSTTAKLVAPDSKKWNQPILLLQKTDELLKTLNIEQFLYPIFVKRSLLHLFFWFDRAKGNSKAKYYKLMRLYLKNLDSSIYTKENLKSSGYYSRAKEIIKKPYWLYLIKNNLPIRVNKTAQNISCEFLGFPVYKNQIAKNKKKIYFCGIQIFSQNLLKKRYGDIEGINHLIFKQNENMLKIQKEFKSLYREIYKLRVYVKVQTAHAYMAKYKNININKDIVIVATGPTAARYKPISGAVHIGINGATRFKKVKLNYLFVQDTAIENSMNNDADNYDCEKFYGHHADIRSKELYPDVKRITMSSRLKTNANLYLIEDTSYGDFAYDITTQPFGDFHSTVFSALQFALYTNPKRIYLVGCDCTQGYFYDSINPFVNSKNVLKGWERFKIFKEENYPETEVISINPVGLKGMFNDIESE